MRAHWAFWVCGVLLAGSAGCPQHRGRTPQPVRPELPAYEWTVQLEGNPWPQGIVGDSLLVWSYRKATDGFLFPIQLSAQAPADGANIWTTPIRPWLLDRNVPWTFNLTRAGAVVGAWVKGDVVRMLNRSTGMDAWSMPRCQGVVAVGGKLWVLTDRALIVLDAALGREERRISLPGRGAAPPVLAGGLVLVLLQSNALVALHPSTGRVAWQLRLTTQADRAIGPLIATGDRVLIPHRPSAKNATEAGLVARRARDGVALWQARLPLDPPKGQRPTVGRLTVAGDLVLWPERAARCLRGLDLSTGRQRFRQCGVHPDVPPVRWGRKVYLLGDDARSRAALARGEPWYTADFPLLELNADTGVTGLVTVVHRRHRRHRSRILSHKQAAIRRPVRAVRLALSPPSDGILYLIQRNKFLTALRVAWPQTDAKGSTP